ncbi:hypothetical protein LXL04_012944 [Taraxacum kok-saghyz]
MVGRASRPQKKKKKKKKKKEGGLKALVEVVYPHPNLHLYYHLQVIPRTMSSSYSATRYYDAEVNPLCLCRTPSLAKKRISWTDDNPGRHFWNCRMSITRRDCGFFDWVDPELNEHYRLTLLRLKREADGVALADARMKLASAKATIAKLKVKLSEVKEKAAALKVEFETMSVRAKVLGFSFASVVVMNGVLVMMKYDV